MNIIIFEGLDNTGKTTAIEKLKDYLIQVNPSLQVNPARIKIIHSSAPSGKTLLEQRANINTYNYKLATQMANEDAANAYDYVLLDRSWYSEYVYGQLYRARTPDDLKSMISICEGYLAPLIKDNKLLYVNFTVSTSKFLLNHEDGLSLSNNDELKIKHEISLFQALYDLVSIPKISISVNANETEFIEKDIILHRITSNFDETNQYNLKQQS